MALDLIGYKTGILTVISKEGSIYVPKSKVYRTLWKCECLCGKIIIKQTQSLRGSKRVKTCGCCEWYIHHNESYTSWMAMKARCNDKNRKDYNDYGGRGITYDTKWGVFVNFFLDMGDPPKDVKTGERLSLDRIDNDKDYNFDNCKWSTRSEQQCNKR